MRTRTMRSKTSVVMVVVSGMLVTALAGPAWAPKYKFAPDHVSGSCIHGGDEGLVDADFGLRRFSRASDKTLRITGWLVGTCTTDEGSFPITDNATTTMTLKVDGGTVRIEPGAGDAAGMPIDLSGSALVFTSAEYEKPRRVERQFAALAKMSARRPNGPPAGALQRIVLQD